MAESVSSSRRTVETLGAVQYVQDVVVSFIEEENRLKTEEEGIVFGPCSRLKEKDRVEMP